jgi:hypothetical protein
MDCEHGSESNTALLPVFHGKAERREIGRSVGGEIGARLRLLSALAGAKLCS